MNTRVLLRGFEGMGHLENFILDAADKALARFERNKPFDVSVVVGTSASRRAGHKPVFECELVVRGPALGRTLVIKKKASDFYSTIRACMRSAGRVLQRTTAQRTTRRRRALSATDFDLIA